VSLSSFRCKFHQSAGAKVRPALVLLDTGDEDFVAAPITSQARRFGIRSCDRSLAGCGTQRGVFDSRPQVDGPGKSRHRSPAWAAGGAGPRVAHCIPLPHLLQTNWRILALAALSLARNCVVLKKWRGAMPCDDNLRRSRLLAIALSSTPYTSREGAYAVTDTLVYLAAGAPMVFNLALYAFHRDDQSTRGRSLSRSQPALRRHSRHVAARSCTASKNSRTPD
jgi:hypothetical protein